MRLAAGGAAARAGRGPGGLRIRLAFRRRLVAAFGLRLALFLGLRRGSAALALEIGGVPAASLQLEAGRGEHLREVGLAAGGAGREGGVAHLLQEFLLVAAARAAILVDRHSSSPMG